jgi:hypothetical protein
MVDYGSSSNIMPYVVCQKLNSEPGKCDTQIVQLDRSNVKVFGELENVLIWMDSNPKVHQTIDIIVVDIL